MIWSKNHPEANQPMLRHYSWKQAAELAIVDAQQAAVLLTSYEAATTEDEAMRRGAILEAARADAVAELRGKAAAYAPLYLEPWL